MMRTGTDAYSGVLDHRKIRGTDDLIIMPLQCGTQWDGLGHILYEYMWNGYDCRNITSAGALKGGIADKRYEFMFVAPALPITGAVGSPVNPYAVK